MGFHLETGNVFYTTKSHAVTCTAIHLANHSIIMVRSFGTLPRALLHISAPRASSTALFFILIRHERPDLPFTLSLCGD